MLTQKVLSLQEFTSKRRLNACVMHTKKKKNNNRDLQSALINIWNENLSTKFPISHEEGMWLQVLLMSNNEQPYKNVLSEGMNDEQDDWEFLFPYGKGFIVKIKSFIILT